MLSTNSENPIIKEIDQLYSSFQPSNLDPSQTSKHLVSTLQHSDLFSQPEQLSSELQVPVKPTPETIIQDIELHLECDDDGNFSLPADPSDNFILPHSVIGQNVGLRVSFPIPKTSVEVTLTFQCSLCDLKFKKESKLAKHLQQEHDVKKGFQCQQCSFATTALRLLRRHTLRKHTNTQNGIDKIYDDVVKKVLGDATDLNYSHTENAESDAFDSLSCPNNSPSNTVTNDFELTHNNVAESGLTNTNFVFICAKCPFKTASQELLDSHFSSTHGKGLFSCDICDFKCKQKKTFLIHQKKHKGDATLKCDVCQKCFFSDTALTRHSKSHIVGELRCSVENCNKQFKNSESLSSHVYKIHKKKSLQCDSRGRDDDVVNKVKTFACKWPNCGKSFRDNYNLKAHYCTHSGENLMKCPNCDYQCVQKSSLTCHMKKMHV